MDCKGSNLGKFYISTERSWSKYLKLHIFRGKIQRDARRICGRLLVLGKTNPLGGSEGRKKEASHHITSHHTHCCELN
jgi:hypothetical protein